MRSETWEDLVRGYHRYRELPVWSTGKEAPSNQGLLPRVVIRALRDRGLRAAAKVAECIERLRKAPGLPDDPRALEQKHVSAAVGARLAREALAGLWEALIFDRDDYACQYCGRGVWQVWEAEGRRRTIRLLIDHARPRARLGERYSLDSAVTACASCAAIKAELPSDPFVDELRSLARAVSLRYGGRGDRGSGAG